MGETFQPLNQRDDPSHRPSVTPLQAAGALVILHRGHGHELLTALQAVWRDELWCLR